MIRSYFSIALRYMIRHKGFSLINLAGLTLGIACSLLIILFVYDELHFDDFHHDVDRVYRIGFEGTLQGKKMKSAQTGFPLGPALQNRLPEAESVVRIASWATFPMRYEERTFTEPNLLLADSNFFRFFDFRLIAGHPDSVLNAKGKIVITESAARRYFDYQGNGDRTPIGKTVVLAQGYTAKISGIAEDPPHNSHFHFTFILSISSWDDEPHVSWVTGKVITYIRLKEGNNTTALTDQLHAFSTTEVKQELQEWRRSNLDQFNVQENALGYFIQPLTSIHLHSNLSEEIEPNGDIQYIYLFGSIAAFITLLACINFMNLSTARSASRAKEVGVRKTVGAQNTRLMGQFLLESYFYILMAVFLALFVVLVFVGPFNILTHKHLNLSVFFTPSFILILLLFIIVVGALAGSYPAFYLTTFSPIDVMKGRIRKGLRSYGIRNALVVFQFFISVGLIISTLVVYSQLRYLQRLSLGFDKKNIINLLHTANLKKNAGNFKKELLSHNGVIAASFCNRLPPNIDWQDVFSTGKPSKDYMLAVYEMDYDHLQAMQYKMVVGRFFSPDFPSDSTAIILNQQAVEKLGIKSLGDQKIFSAYGSTRGVEREIIGVMQDFNFQSLKNRIQPMAIVLGRQPNWEMAIKIKDGSHPQVVRHMKYLWKKYAPDAPFEYTYLDQNFQAKHEAEKRTGILFLLFTTLAIVIACLGLFGLATFTAEQRTKEIGIRKVVGATVTNIVFMLNKDFLKLVFIANLLAWPVTWWLMQQWLDQFAYHTMLRWWMFLVAGLTTILIAFLSVSFQAIRAGKGNPVNSLRDE
jgi:putative ABC transport system permease protein